MTRSGVVALALGALVAASAPAWAQRGDDDEDEDRRDDEDDRDRRDDEDDEGEDRRDDDDDGGVRPNRRDDGDDDRGGGDDGGDGDGGGGDDGGGGEEDDEYNRNKDNTRPGGGRADQNSFQKIRFFVDKEESAKTAKGTLFQGSLTSSSFIYRESGGTLSGIAAATGVGSNSQFMRMFSDLRAQLDGLRLGGTRWDFRLDARGRLMNDPGQSSAPTPLGLEYPTRVQGGVFGRNELELKELWFVRGGDRADVFVGRQFITDLGAIKIDGVRVDYASSEKLTFIGFGGLYPFRGSRSLSTDYIRGRDDAGNLTGRVIPFAGGGGAAYRTEHTYGSFGGVTIVPLKGEQPRVYATGNGYWRTGPKLDFYHFVVIDLYGSAGTALTNLSLGVNARPVPRIRASASVNRVDTETLNITAQAFLNEPTANIISNETTVQRIASDQARGGLSVSLGALQQIEISTSLTYRRRPSFTLTDGMALEQTFPASSSVEVLFQAVHRSLFKQVRMGLDVSRIFKVGGGASYARTASVTGRLHASREFDEGKGEWEAEIAYTAAKDSNVNLTCGIGDIETCYGSSVINLIEVGGAMYYRLRDDLFLVGLANIGRYNLQYRPLGVGVESDPPVTSLSGFLRLAYRF